MYREIVGPIYEGMYREIVETIYGGMYRGYWAPFIEECRGEYWVPFMEECTRQYWGPLWRNALVLSTATNHILTAVTFLAYIMQTDHLFAINCTILFHASMFCQHDLFLVSERILSPKNSKTNNQQWTQ